MISRWLYSSHVKIETVSRGIFNFRRTSTKPDIRITDIRRNSGCFSGGYPEDFKLISSGYPLSGYWVYYTAFYKDDIYKSYMWTRHWRARCLHFFCRGRGSKRNLSKTMYIYTHTYKYKNNLKYQLSIFWQSCVFYGKPYICIISKIMDIWGLLKMSFVRNIVRENWSQ